MNGQPTSHDVDLLEEEHIAIAASILMMLGGSLNGHAGMLLLDADYAMMAVGTPFVAPINPGIYPVVGVTAVNCLRQVAEHKDEIKQFHTYAGVGMGLKDLILKAIDEDYLVEIKHERLAFFNVTAVQMMTHLHQYWGSVDFVDITSLMAECDTPWSIAKIPTSYFNQVEKAMKKLVHANIHWDQCAMMNKVLKSFKGAGNYNAAIRKWEARPIAIQMWENLKVLMCTTYACQTIP